MMKKLYSTECLFDMDVNEIFLKVKIIFELVPDNTMEKICKDLGISKEYHDFLNEAKEELESVYKEISKMANSFISNQFHDAVNEKAGEILIEYARELEEVFVNNLCKGVEK